MRPTGLSAWSVRIGVNTGEAVVLIDARPEMGQGMVAGTFRATQRVFEFKPLDPIEAKGKAEPVPVWQALRPTALSTRRWSLRSPSPMLLPSMPK